MENRRSELPSISVPGPLTPPERQQAFDAFRFPAFILRVVRLIRAARVTGYGVLSQ